MYSATDLRRASLVLALFALVVACSSCTDTSDETGDAPSTSTAAQTKCAAGFLGDPNAKPEIELRTVKGDGSDVPLSDGDDLALVLPPQGGRVGFVGVRIKNMDGCGVELVGVLRDPTSKQIRLDGRTINLTRMSDGSGTTGYGADITDPSSIASYSNVPICPNQWAETDLFDKPFTLEVEVTDRRRVKVRASITVMPKCAEPGAKADECRCICTKGYVLGQKC